MSICHHGVTHSCSRNVAARGVPEQRLCAGLARISAAPCNLLQNASFVADVVRAIGLVNDPRGCALYGAHDCMHVVNDGHGTTAGVYQSPNQIAKALIALSRLGIATYLEVGIHAAWTTALMTAYLDRFAVGLRRGWAVDINVGLVDNATRTMLKRRSTSVHLRHELPSLLSTAADGIDLCFIDGSHSCKLHSPGSRLLAWLRTDPIIDLRAGWCQSVWHVLIFCVQPSRALADSGVLADFVELAPRCRNLMFHDTVDVDVSMLQERTHRYRSISGGVPAMWADLKAEASTDASCRVFEFVEQPPGVHRPVFGIGLLHTSASVGAGETGLVERVMKRAEGRREAARVSTRNSKAKTRDGKVGSKIGR